MEWRRITHQALPPLVAANQRQVTLPKICDDAVLSKYITKKHNNCVYYGHLMGDSLSKLYLKSDVLLFPSRAESLSLVMLEAIAYGLPIVDSKDVSLQLPSYIETSVAVRNTRNYVQALESIYENVKKHKINNEKIHKYTQNHFSHQFLDPIFDNLILGIK